jgi:hypothetical protein
MKTNLELVEGQLQAYNQLNLEDFCSFYHQDIVVESLTEKEILFQGINTFKDRYRNLFRNNPNQICILKSRILVKDSIIDEELIIGREGFQEGIKAVAIYFFQDGLISRVVFV